jgi:5-methylcytosine-specific restriction endonuclease McrA
MDDATRDLVRRRAGGRCEYCLLPQDASPLLSFHVEHIIAKQHLDDDADDLNLLALACNRCNAYKGTNLSSIDPETKITVPLYNPRQDAWRDHFLLKGGGIIGLTPTGRATVRLLHMNAPQRVELRDEWLTDGGTFS